MTSKGRKDIARSWVMSWTKKK